VSNSPKEKKQRVRENWWQQDFHWAPLSQYQSQKRIFLNPCKERYNIMQAIVDISTKIYSSLPAYLWGPFVEKFPYIVVLQKSGQNGACAF